MPEGALVLDKPAGITSHDAVQAARRVLGEARIGHLGTLDPFATGVLVLLIGRATCLAQFYKDREKIYEGTIRFGYSTDTFDLTGTPTSPLKDCTLEESVLRGLFQDLQGTYLQTPPAHSAKKLSGVAAHRLARRGEKVELTPVPVAIHQLELRSIAGAEAQFYARVSSGTYIRSLAHELGERLGTGAHLTALRRIAVGEFTLGSAVPLDQLEQLWQHGSVPVVPPEELLPEFPSMLLSETALRGVRHGRDLELETGAATVKLTDQTGRLCAIAQRAAGGLYHPAVVLPNANPGPPASSSPADAIPQHAQSS